MCQGLHKLGMGVCDLKPDSFRIQEAADGTFLSCCMLDLGGSVTYQGDLADCLHLALHLLVASHTFVVEQKLLSCTLAHLCDAVQKPQPL